MFWITGGKDDAIKLALPRGLGESWVNYEPEIAVGRRPAHCFNQEAAMKRAVMLVLLFCLLPCAALAETLWTAEGDSYLHAVRDCMSREHPLEANVEGGRFPCPICTQDDRDMPGLSLIELPGFTVVRMTDAWLLAQDHIGGVFGETSPDTETNPREIEDTIARYLHGDAYAAFRAEAADTGNATAYVYSPSSLMDDAAGDLHVSTNRRHLYGAWYQTFPSVEKPDWNFRFFAGDMTLQNGSLTVHMPDEWNDFEQADFPAPEAQDRADVEPSMVLDQSNFTLELYETDEMDFIRLSLRGVDVILKPTIHLRCEGWAEDVVIVEPYGNMDMAWYGAVITRAEAEALRAGGAVTLDYPGIAERAEFGASEYGIGQTDDYDAYITDRAGSFVVGPFLNVKRSGDVFCASTNIYNDSSLAAERYGLQVFDIDRGDLLSAMQLSGIPVTFPGGCWMDEREHAVQLYTEGADAPFLTLASEANPEELERDALVDMAIAAWGSRFPEYQVIAAEMGLYDADMDDWDAYEALEEAVYARVEERLGPVYRTPECRLYGHYIVYAGSFDPAMDDWFSYRSIAGDPFADMYDPDTLDRQPELAGPWFICPIRNQWNAAFVVWYPEGALPPTPADLGLVDASGQALVSPVGVPQG
ncbi:MAG: hypothetical protein IJI26_11775 [Clostridia bacterium]|nr:hypothetical protein [Clostridia bacterium]